LSSDFEATMSIAGRFGDDYGYVAKNRCLFDDKTLYVRYALDFQ